MNKIHKNRFEMPFNPKLCEKADQVQHKHKHVLGQF